MPAPRSLVALVILLAPGILLAPVWPLAGLGAGEDDILYYYPSRALFGEFAVQAQLPYINPWTGLGRPFLADPQSAVFYPPTWLFAVLPPRWAYSALLWMHYSLALLGVYRLLRASRQERGSALFGALVFAFGGFMLAHRAHFTMQAAGAWTPWVFWRLTRLVEAGGTRRIATAALVAAAQLLAGHVQIAALTALGSLVFVIALCERQHAAALARWLASWALAGALFAVQLLPTLAYLAVCSRAHLGYADFVENSWNPASLVGLVLPMLMGQRTPNFFDQAYWGPSHQVEQFAYVGAAPLVLALLTLRRGWRADPQLRAWMALALFGLLLALGRYGPICPLLYWLPGAGLFRVPARAMLLVTLALAVLAALNLGLLAGALSPAHARLRAAMQAWLRRPIALAVAGIAGPLALVALVAPFLPEPYRASAWAALAPRNPALLVAAGTWLCALLALRMLARHWRTAALPWLVAGLTALDLGVLGWSLDVPAHARTADQLLRSDERDQWLAPVRAAPGRVWVVTTRRPGALPGEYVRSFDKGVANTNILDHFESLTDYGPLHPRRWVEAFAFRPWGESERAVELLSDDQWMTTLGIAWLLLCEPELPVPPRGQLLLTTRSGMRLIRMPPPGPDAFLESREARVSLVRRRPYELHAAIEPPESPDAPAGRARAARSPHLIIRQLAVPGWRATCDDGALAIEPFGPGLISVHAPPGVRSIVLRYEPPLLRTGAMISGAGVAVVAALLALRGGATRRFAPVP